MAANKSILGIVTGPLTFDEVSDAIHFVFPDEAFTAASENFAPTWKLLGGDMASIPLDRADYSDLRTATRKLGLTVQPGEGNDRYRDAIRGVTSTPKVPTAPKVTSATLLADDGLSAAREALGLGDARLASVITRQLDAALAEALKDMRPTVYKIGAAPEVEIKGTAHGRLRHVLPVVAARLIPYLVGPAGTGKSFLCKQVAEAMAIDFATIVCHPTMTLVDVKGYRDGHGNYQGTDLRRCLEFGGVVLIDEMDGCHPGVAKGINEIMAAKPGDLVSFPDGMVEVHKDFRIVVAANTFGLGADRVYVAGVQLDASTLDRVVYIEIDYDTDLERTIAAGIAGTKGEAWAVKVQSIRANMLAAGASLRVIVSTRAVEKGATLLAAGLGEKAAYDMCIGSAHPKATNDKLLAGVKLEA